MTKTRILLADDQPQVTNLLRVSLEKTGNYEVSEENKGSNVVATAREFKPDLIFLDVMMPDMSGDEIANQILEDPDLADIKIVFLTSLVSKQESERQGGAIGGRRILAKPVKLDELIECIEEQLG